MKTKSLVKKPFYKKLWFWLLILLLVLLVKGGGDSPEAESFVTLASLVFILLIIAIISNFITNRKIKKQLLANEKESQRRKSIVDAVQLSETTPSKLLTRPSEVCYFSSNAVLYEHVSKQSNFGGASVRFRVAKGVSISTGGGSSSKSVELTPVSDGELVITDQRIAFAGDNKSFDTTHHKVINIEYLSDAVKISISGRQKAYIVSMSDDDVLIFQRTYQLIRENLLSS